MGLLTPEQEEEQLQRLRGGFTPLETPDEKMLGGGPPTAAALSGDSAAAAQRPVIAKPNALPRGVTLPPVQSTPMQGDISHFRLPDSGSPAAPPLSQTQLDQDRLNHEKNLTPKIWRPGGAGGIKNPILRGLARVGDVAGEAMFPTITGQIPGTSLHHKLEVQGAQGRVNQDINAADMQSQTAERNATAQAKLNTDQNAGKTIEEQTFAGLLKQTNPDTGQPFTRMEAFNKVKQAGQDVKPTPRNEQPVAQAEAAQINAEREQVFQVLHPGQPLPDYYKAKAGDTRDDVHAQDERLGRLGSEEGTAATRENTRAQHATAANESAGREVEGIRDKATKTLESGLQADSEKIYNLHEAAGMLDSPNGMKDALSVVKALVATSGGKASGVRITNAELGRLASARGIKGSIEVMMNHAINGESLSTEQRQQLQGIVGDILSLVGTKQAAVRKAYGDMLTAGSVQEIRQIQKELNTALGEMESGKQQNGGGGDTVEYVRDGSGKLVPKK
jgi:hypothetical protein